ncbi:hypothetical protein LINPERPRIM_LOCUS9414, partial [Linum perenne]
WNEQKQENNGSKGIELLNDLQLRKNLKQSRIDKNSNKDNKEKLKIKAKRLQMRKKHKIGCVRHMTIRQPLPYIFSVLRHMFFFHRFFFFFTY